MFSDSDKHRFLELLNRSLADVQELNDLDWKESLSSKSERLKEHLSAFSNLPGGGFLALGVNDRGIPEGIDPAGAKQIIQKLGSMAREGLEPPISLDFETFDFRSVKVLGVRVHEAVSKPVHKRGRYIEDSFIRAGGQTRKMSAQEIRAAIMSSRIERFEELPAAVQSDVSDALSRHFDFPAILKKLGRPPSGNPEADLEYFHSLKLIARRSSIYVPTNLGVLAAAKDMAQLGGYERFAIRVTSYRGTSKLFTEKDLFFNEGYAMSLDKVVSHIVERIPVSEIIERATRIQVPIIPVEAIRELLGNAVVHRDYTRTNAFVTVDIFQDRIEITNPGGLLPELPLDRIIDFPSRTRNEVLADLMKKLGFFEERGSGIDKAVGAMEIYGLPPVKFESTPDHFRATLFAPKQYKDMEKDERIEAVYQHACLNFVSSHRTTNSSIRERFKFDDRQSTKVSRLIADALEAGRIKVANAKAAHRDIHYLPYWA